MKQTYEEVSVPITTAPEEAVARSTVFDDVFRTIAQKMSQLLIPLINEVFHTNYSEDEDFEQLRNEHYEKYGKIITDSIIRIGKHIYHLECQSEKDAEMVIPKENEARKGMDDIMGGKVLTLPSDFIRQGREEGVLQGRLDEIFSSVQDRDYSISRGAQKAEMSIEQFKKVMEEAGYKLPDTV